MNQAAYIARQVQTAFFGNNWCGISLQKALENVGFAQATQPQSNTHSIAELVFHIRYYFEGVGAVLKGSTLEIRDKYSFEMPSITSDADWSNLQERTWQSAKEFIQEVEQLSNERMSAIFVEEKYGDYHKNLTGIIEHLYYHLGQIVLLKKQMGI